MSTPPPKSSEAIPGHGVLAACEGTPDASGNPWPAAIVGQRAMAACKGRPVTPRPPAAGLVVLREGLRALPAGPKCPPPGPKRTPPAPAPILTVGAAKSGHSSAAHIGATTAKSAVLASQMPYPQVGASCAPKPCAPEAQALHATALPPLTAQPTSLSPVAADPDCFLTRIAAHQQASQDAFNRLKGDLGSEHASVIDRFLNGSSNSATASSEGPPDISDSSDPDIHEELPLQRSVAASASSLMEDVLDVRVIMSQQQGFIH